MYLEYQRVGRELVQLQEQRGPADCAELVQRFRMIRLDEALDTPRARRDTFAELTDLRMRAERLKGIVISSACLNNPLAADCR